MLFDQLEVQHGYSDKDGTLHLQVKFPNGSDLPESGSRVTLRGKSFQILYESRARRRVRSSAAYNVFDGFRQWVELVPLP